MEVFDQMKYYLSILAVIITFAMYQPLWVRLYRRKTSGDHSKLTWIGIMALQLLALAVAILDHAKSLYLIYYPAQILVVGFTMILVWRYYE